MPAKDTVAAADNVTVVLRGPDGNIKTQATAEETKR